MEEEKIKMIKEKRVLDEIWKKRKKEKERLEKQKEEEVNKYLEEKKLLQREKAKEQKQREKERVAQLVISYYICSSLSLRTLK